MDGLVSVIILNDGSRNVENRYTIPAVPSCHNDMYVATSVVMTTCEI